MLALFFRKRTVSRIPLSRVSQTSLILITLYRYISLREKGAGLLIIVILHISCGSRSLAMLNESTHGITNAFGKTISELTVNNGYLLWLPWGYHSRVHSGRVPLDRGCQSFFFSPQLHLRKRSINHPVMAAPRFLSPRVYTSARTRSCRSIYI